MQKISVRLLPQCRTRTVARTFTFALNKQLARHNQAAESDFLTNCTELELSATELRKFAHAGNPPNAPTTGQTASGNHGRKQ
jgi:hypothetical protein